MGTADGFRDGEIVGFEEEGRGVGGMEGVEEGLVVMRYEVGDELGR